MASIAIFSKRSVAVASVAKHTSEKARFTTQSERQGANPEPAEGYQDQAQPAPPPADPADEIEHLAQLHSSGALTDEEFATAKANILGS